MLRDVGTLIPTAALFVLVVGTNNPLVFITSYAGLVMLGAAIGVAVTFLLPAMFLAPAQQAAAERRESLRRIENGEAEAHARID